MGLNQVSLLEITNEIDPEVITQELLSRYLSPIDNDGIFTPNSQKMNGIESRALSPPKRDLNIITIEELHRNYENLYVSEKPAIQDQSTENNFYQQNFSRGLSSKQSETLSKTKLSKGKSGRESRQPLSRNKTIEINENEMFIEDDSNIVHESFMSGSKVPNLGQPTDRVKQNLQGNSKRQSKINSIVLNQIQNEEESGYVAPNTSQADNIRQIMSRRMNSIRNSKATNKLNSRSSNYVNLTQNVNIPLMQPGHLQALLPRTPLNMSENDSPNNEDNVNIDIQNIYPESMNSSQGVTDQEENYIRYPNHNFSESEDKVVLSNDKHKFSPEDSLLIESNNELQESNLCNDTDVVYKEDFHTKDINIPKVTSIANMYKT